MRPGPQCRSSITIAQARPTPSMRRNLRQARKPSPRRLSPVPRPICIREYRAREIDLPRNGSPRGDLRPRKNRVFQGSLPFQCGDGGKNHGPQGHNLRPFQSDQVLYALPGLRQGRVRVNRAASEQARTLRSETMARKLGRLGDLLRREVAGPTCPIPKSRLPPMPSRPWVRAVDPAGRRPKIHRYTAFQRESLLSPA